MFCPNLRRTIVCRTLNQMSVMLRMCPVGKETVAVESLCFPVVVKTRPQGGCDPVLPLSKGMGRNGHEAIVSDCRSGCQA